MEDRAQKASGAAPDRLGFAPRARRHTILAGAMLGLVVMISGSIVRGEAPVGQRGANRSVAVTFDDLPATALGPDGPCNAVKLREVTDRLLEQIEAAGTPALGLVTEIRVCDELRDELLPELLTQWLDAGHELGNHTFSHPDLNRTAVEVYKADIEKGSRTVRRLMESRGDELRFFRYPMLHAGDTAEKKAAVEAYLREQGYLNAPVTIDNQEWVFSVAYSRALAAGDRDLAQRIGKAYLDFMVEVFAFYEVWSEQVVGYEPAQVLLLHANELNADYYVRLVERIVDRGYAFVTLAEALEDPAYSRQDDYVGRRGLSWLHRWALTEGLELEEEPREPEWIAQLSR